ncbi:MAG: DUF58 domain-containing protein [Planctomycetia bacterium]|nr:DUF58 domain-containing protein [Planctomycetia bacterium]
MTPASKRFLPPEAIARIARLELRARAVVEGVLAGLHKSPYKGQSVEFLQHREYVRGDDLRRVDWKVWGRQDRLYIKEFEEETNLRLTLLVDGSASMDYRSGALSKYDYAATLAASLAWLALSHGDAVGCAVFDEKIRASVPARTKRSHLSSVVDVLETSRSNRPTAFGPVLRSLSETLPRRGMVVIISDLLGDREGVFQGMQFLRRRGHDLVLLHVMDEDELTFPFEGPTRFEGLELPEHIACNPRALREGYLAAIEEFLANARKRSAAARCDYSLIRTGEPVDAALVQFLSRRSSTAV